jgi:hypothetical protein
VHAFVSFFGLLSDCVHQIAPWSTFWRSQILIFYRLRIGLRASPCSLWSCFEVFRSLGRTLLLRSYLNPRSVADFVDFRRLVLDSSLYFQYWAALWTQTSTQSLYSTAS